ncbi:MAG: exonuclease domain-containing protein [Lachnospiraceae bacterium]|nr:exonuclease domain-containing protein [Lachnospiraceae bacterium]
MNYIVLDLEWNQAAYKAYEEENLPFEIIEIGAVKMDENANITDSFQRLIRPQVYPFLLRRTKQITGWTDEDLDRRGVYFEVAARAFLEWCGKDYLFLVWGGSDLTQLERNMDYYKIRIPWKYPFKYLDVQKLYALEHQEGKARRTLESVVELMELESDRPFHHAADDAMYTAEIFKRLDRKRFEEYFSVDYYRVPRNRFEEETFRFKTYSKFVSRRFNLREEVAANPRVREMNCRVCGKHLKKEIAWFNDGHTYLSLGRCKEHGLMRGRIRIKPAERYDGFFAIKTFKSCTPEEEEIIRMKRENVTKKRRIRRKKSKKKETEA